MASLLMTTASANDTSLPPTDAATPAAERSSWPYLVGFIGAAVGISLFIAIVAKCKTLHRYFTSYRHHPLPETDSVNHSAADLSNATLARQQADGRHQTFPQAEDDDGFIEDNYIQPGDRLQEDEEGDEEGDDLFNV